MIWIITFVLIAWFTFSTWLWIKHHTTFVFGGIKFRNLTLPGMVMFGPGILVMSIFISGMALVGRFTK